MTEVGKSNKYRIIIAEQRNSDVPWMWTWIGSIGKYFPVADKWEVIYVKEYHYKFTAYVGLSRMLKTLKKWDKVKEKNGISEK